MGRPPSRTMRTWPGTSSGMVGSSSHTGASSVRARAARMASSTLQRMLASTIRGNSGAEMRAHRAHALHVLSQ